MDREIHRMQMQLAGIVVGLNRLLAKAFPLEHQFVGWEGAKVRQVSGVYTYEAHPHFWPDNASVRCIFGIPSSRVEVKLILPNRGITLDLTAVMAEDWEIYFWKQGNVPLTEQDFRSPAAA